MLLQFLLTVILVGFVTAGLNIRFDRFFTILLLLFLFGFDVKDAINIFLWVMMAGSIMIILDNKGRIKNMPKKIKTRMFVFVPIITFFTSFAGTVAFAISSQAALIAVIGALAMVYGIRLMIIHFEEHELKFERGHSQITKICGIIGPAVSGLFIGFVGTSLKPLKMPLAIKLGKLNAQQAHLDNVITAFFAAFFAILWHLFYMKGVSLTSFYNQMILGLALFTGIHFVFEPTNMFFRNSWRKTFQTCIGAVLVIASIKVFFTGCMNIRANLVRL